MERQVARVLALEKLDISAWGHPGPLCAVFEIHYGTEAYYRWLYIANDIYPLHCEHIRENIIPAREPSCSKISDICGRVFEWGLWWCDCYSTSPRDRNRVYKNHHIFVVSDSLFPLEEYGSGQIHGKFLRLLYILAHRRTDKYFADMGDHEPGTDAFTWRRSQYFWKHKAAIGLSTAVAVAREVSGGVREVSGGVKEASGRCKEVSGGVREV